MGVLALEAYCLKCREKREMVHPVATFTVRGAPITKGECQVCGTKLSKMGLTDAHSGLEKPVVQDTPKKAASSKKTARSNEAKSKSTSTSKKVATSKKTAKSRAVKSTSAPKRNAQASKLENGKRSNGNNALGKDLVIVESPAKAKTIGKFLGEKYKVLASVGHIRDLLKTQLSVDVNNDFAPKYRVPNEKIELAHEIKNLAARSNKVYLATDPDREGESIAWHLMDTAQIDPQKTERVVFHEITKEAIADAFAHPREVDMDLVNAQQTRRILDRLVGYGVSPILWAKVRSGLSAGRVQSVALRLVVEREREIQDFVPVEYWVISAEFYPESSPNFYKAKLFKINQLEPVLPDETSAMTVVEDMRRAAYHLDAIKISQRKVKPSAPFITSTLQQEASRKLGFLTRKTMSVAQQLYEGIDIGNGGETGLITYMRTDSVHVAAQAVNEARNYIKTRYGEAFLPEQAPHYRTRAASAQEAHEAIRPTAVLHEPAALKNHLTNDQFRLYKLIWQRFVASQMNPAINEMTTVEVLGKSTDNQYLLKATSKKNIFKGFQAVYEESVNEDQTDQEELVDLPLAEMKEGQVQVLKDIEYIQHFTQPPPRFSEASLIQVLEENKIGRPSTYSPIISTIQSRGYVSLEDKRLIPTETGFIVNDLVVEYFPSIVDIGFTSDMEEKLDEIAKGQLNWVNVLHEFYNPFEASLVNAKTHMPVTKIGPEKVGRACPLCGNDLVFRNGRFGKFISCSTFPKCRYTENFQEKIGVTCPTCKTGDVIKKRSKKGRVFYGCSRYPECIFTSWNLPLKQPCPNCGGTLVAQNKRQARCLDCSKVFPLDQTETPKT
ncbi:MAG: type I DNA topoisomerase [Anaerolineaceae bacterium]